MRLAALLLILLAGCQATPSPNGVPNLEQFSQGKNLWRGGQPDESGWAYLKKHGITNVVKLNERSEGEDFGAPSKVQYFPIDSSQQIGWSQFNPHRPVAAITPNTFVHCQHGVDRTGLIVALYRVQVEGWSKEKAETEMLSHGFHKELHGLWDYWEDYKP